MTTNVPRGLIVAAALGMVHAAFSLSWTAGGTLPVWSLGDDLVESFRGREWLLVPIGIAKLVAAVAPLALVRWGWLARVAARFACRMGAFVLVVWGGLNTIVGSLVLAGVVRPESGFDRSGMIGHAYLWDPLFLVWAAAVTTGLIASRGRTIEPRCAFGWRDPLAAALAGGPPRLG